MAIVDKPPGHAKRLPRVSVRIPPCVDALEMGRIAERCEELGFCGVWFPDSPILWRDPYISAAFALMRTQQISVGVAVSNPVTRHLSVIAGMLRTLSELHMNRFKVGLGTGHSATQIVGLSRAGSAEMREAIRAIRTLYRGEAYDFGAGQVVMEGAVAGGALFMAATGPRNLQVAGEVADGVIILNGVKTDALRASLAHVVKGEKLRDPQLPALQRVVTAFCLPTDDLERDARLLKPLCVAMAEELGARSALAGAGVHVEAGQPSSAVYPDLIHARDLKQAVRAVDHLVSDGDIALFARRFCASGSVGEILLQMESMVGDGVEEVILQHLGSFSTPDDAWLETCAQLAKTG